MKRRILYTIIIFTTTIGLFGCLTKKDSQVYTTVEEMPQFPGGEGEMQRYIMNNMKLPKEEESRYCFSPAVRFVVTKKGKIRDIEIRKKDCPLSDSLANTVKNMPRWTPGRHKGKAVDVYVTLPLLIHPKY